MNPYLRTTASFKQLNGLVRSHSLSDVAVSLGPTAEEEGEEEEEEAARRNQQDMPEMEMYRATITHNIGMTHHSADIYDSFSEPCGYILIIYQEEEEEEEEEVEEAKLIYLTKTYHAPNFRLNN